MRTQRSMGISGLAAAVLATGLSPVYAATYTWTGGGGNGNMSNLANWSDSPTWPDLSTGNHDLTFAGSTQTSPTIQNNNWTINRITFAAGASAFTVGTTGGVITLNDGIVKNATTNQRVNTSLTLAGSQTFQNTASGGIFTVGTDTANQRLLTMGAHNLAVDTTQNFTITSTISSTTGILTKNGSGALFLSGNNTGLESLTLNAGTLNLNANNAGGKNITVAGGNLVLNSSSSAATRSHNTNIAFGGGTGAWGVSTGNHAGTETLAGNLSTTTAFAAGGGNFWRVNLGQNGTNLILSGDNSGFLSDKTESTGADKAI